MPQEIAQPIIPETDDLSPEALRAYERAIENLSEILAHRLRSYVSSIEGFADLLTVTLDSPDQRDMALRIFEGAAHIERILSELQQYSQRPDPVLREVHLSHFVRETVRAIGEDAEARVDLKVETDCCINADPQLLRQALWMVIQNALDATDPSEHVRLSVLQSRGFVHLEVWNRGAMEIPDARATVFEPFFTTKAKNLGVGLPIARRIAEAHGGSLKLRHTTPAEGTSFVCSLPVEPDGTHPKIPASASFPASSPPTAS